MPHMVTFPLSHPRRAEVEAAFGLGRFIAIERQPLGPRNYCHRNVDRVIAARGGRGVLGWQIEWWPGLFVRALHHAIAELPSGRLIDVTCGDPADRAASTTFVPMVPLEAPLAGGAPALVPNRHFVIADAPEVHEMIAASEAQRALKERLDAAMRARGFVERGDEMAAPDTTAERAFEETFGAEMRASVARVDAAVRGCERLAAGLSGA